MKSVLQFRPWENCHNHCDFCSLSDKMVNYNTEEKLKSLNNILTILKDEKRIKEKYDTIGFIGGEFFDGQIKDVEDKWFEVMKQVSKIDPKNIWMATNLFCKNTKDLYDTLSYLNKINVLVCTSYDTVGRFKSKQQFLNWGNNINDLARNGYKVFVTSILTEDFLKEVLNDNFILPKGVHNFNFINYRIPDNILISVLIESNPKGKKEAIDIYRKHLFDELKNTNLPTRNLFLKFLLKINFKFNKSFLKDFANIYYHPDNSLQCIKEKNIFNTNRWDINSIFNLSCGHPLYALGYKDSNKCMMCDALEIYKGL